MKLSILLPVYNELKTIADVLELVKNLNLDKEIVLVDDFSTDGTREFLKSRFKSDNAEIKVFYHDKNRGKGAAIKTALSHAEGDYIIVQDADMEYSPHDIVRLVEFVKDTDAKVVYGSRFLETWKTTSFPHFLVNKFLTTLTNVLFRASLTDMETCYKMIRTDIMRNLNIRAKRFEFEPEVTAKLLKKGYVIKEVPISYRGRGYDEGKKITWRDGIEAVIVLFRLRLNKYL